MSKYLIMLDQNRCISCHACEVHCQMKNRVPADARLGKLITVGPVSHEGKPRMLNLFMPCFQCERPWCVTACPTGAMTRRESDGIVYVQEDLCVGCKACIKACPWQVPQWNDYTGRVMKCDYCRDRIDVGEKPACVAGCTSHALSFVRPNEASAHTREDYARRILLRHP
ncbi:4Fe-4S dicluster domain-containing protein [Desulfovibrio sulfodismutans]|uniref:4Fe-4S dicluster domain-containing protein n=1 Tax=Desulfolutivibrio sulfodismutans TaxID=63561 RepID=A0A7K3NLP5_9BACT|nr:4Fe-4S dicluster domain-containing protein [Desulfolutivibrio sulfodismutans]NDY57027.1 4Fe-4S dicluster domain-containing protein [Desulfolutivibrio sulfodismutans]QLA12703.1 4Fe-4S dicluster domain-containing protein [Desulfolutivibrio sulfodismutans DSM 3696]